MSLAFSSAALAFGGATPVVHRPGLRAPQPVVMSAASDLRNGLAAGAPAAPRRSLSLGNRG